MTRRYGFAVAALAAVSWLTACNKEPPLPKTYSVTGTVTKGGKAVKGGSIRFSIANEPMLIVTGEIGDDGSFSLRTIKDNQKADGAPEGEYQVSVQPPSVEAKGGAGQGKYVEPIVLKDKIKVKAETNTLKIELP